MIYSEDAKREHIRELQRLLYEISFIDRNIPTIIPNGEYGEETAGAIKVFQKENEIPATGDTDFDTWERLAFINRLYYPDVLKPDVFKADTVLMPGCTGTAVYFVQIMLNVIGAEYGNMPATELTGVYDAQTERSVECFKKLTENECSPEGIDIYLWNDIVAKFNKVV